MLRKHYATECKARSEFSRIETVPTAAGFTHTLDQSSRMNGKLISSSHFQSLSFLGTSLTVSRDQPDFPPRYLDGFSPSDIR